MCACVAARARAPECARAGTRNTCTLYPFIPRDRRRRRSTRALCAHCQMSVVTCHGTQLKMSPNGSATEAAAAQLIGEGTILPLLAAASPVHYWRHAFEQKPHAARRSALCKKAAPWHALTFGSHGDFVKAAIGLCKQAESAGAETCRHLTMSRIHCPSNHPCSTPKTQVFSNGSIRSCSAFWNEANYLKNILKKRFVFVVFHGLNLR